MFLGHLAVGFAAKKATPKTQLVLLMIAGEFVDLLWPLFLLMGIEVAEVTPGITVATPLNLIFYPWSHSLLMHIVWGVVLGGVVYGFRKDARESMILAAVVVSHWVLDVISHRPDMPIAPGMDLKLGLGLWNSIPGTLIVEYGLFAAGVALYTLATRPKNRIGTFGFWGFVVFMALMFLGNIFGPQPPDIQAVIVGGIASWVFFLWVWWFDRNREAKEKQKR